MATRKSTSNAESVSTGDDTQTAPGSTRHYQVNVFRAEYLSKLYPGYSPVEIRETLEGVPVKKAIRLLVWSQRKSPQAPYRKLREWARRNEEGFYSPEMRRREHDEVYGEYLRYLDAKRVEKREKTGVEVLLPSEVEDLTRTFWAPETRARMAEISRRVWESYGDDETEQQEEEEGVA